RVARQPDSKLREKEHAKLVARMRSDRTYLASLIHQMSGINTSIQDRYRVFCLTTKPTNILMWSHYADNHHGICLQFSCRNSVFLNALKVEYSEAYPLLDLTEDDDLLPLLAKAVAWSYEDEYR